MFTINITFKLPPKSYNKPFFFFFNLTCGEYFTITVGLMYNLTIRPSTH